MAEDTHTATRETSVNPVGVAVMIIMGIVFALAPRMGWEFSAYGLDRLTVAFLATFVAASIPIEVRRRNSAWHGRVLSEKALLKCEPAQREGRLPEPDASAEHAYFKANVKARAAAPERHSPSIHRIGAAGGESSDEDPIWNTNWATLSRTPGQPTEVFEMNDTPTWLARLQHRRNQAERAGKKRLVQKIDKEIAVAEAASKARNSSKDISARSDPAESIASGQAGPQDDVWSMDWADWAPKDQQVPAVAAA